jgi:hypothetical protein
VIGGADHRHGANQRPAGQGASGVRRPGPCDRSAWLIQSYVDRSVGHAIAGEKPTGHRGRLPRGTDREVRPHDRSHPDLWRSRLECISRVQQSNTIRRRVPVGIVSHQPLSAKHRDALQDRRGFCGIGAAEPWTGRAVTPPKSGISLRGTRPAAMVFRRWRQAASDLVRSTSPLQSPVRAQRSRAFFLAAAPARSLALDRRKGIDAYDDAGLGSKQLKNAPRPLSLGCHVHPRSRPCSVASILASWPVRMLPATHLTGG